MKVHRLICQQLIHTSVEAIWDFFSNAQNLDVLTPAYMRFTITSGSLPDHIYPGQIITYKVSPILSVPLFWMTEITHVIPNRLFVDEQRKGPYRIWHHEHHFEQKVGAVLMTDIVHYQLPFGVFGRLAHWLFVKKQIKSIFEYRHDKIEEIFNK